jgi:hypothetical protein
MLLPNTWFQFLVDLIGETLTMTSQISASPNVLHWILLNSIGFILCSHRFDPGEWNLVGPCACAEKLHMCSFSAHAHGLCELFFDKALTSCAICAICVVFNFV